jgi:hypothetical protein
LLSTAKDELEELPDELVDPAELLGDEVLPVAPVEGLLLEGLLLEELLLEELLVLAAFVVPVAETASPTSPESVTIVPSCGA